MNAKIQPMELQEFVRRFNILKTQGYVPSTRKGPTGIGHTLETIIGIRENNIALPDLDGIELKAHRTQSSNLITLFTFNHKVWKVPPLEAIKKYGSKDKTGRLGIYYTMSQKPNSAGLYLYVDAQGVSVRHTNGDVIAFWDILKLTERFIQKMPALIFVSAFSEERDGIEYFSFHRAQLLKGISPELLINQFKSGNIVVDLRLHDKVTMARNHGTGFRVYENRLTDLFNSTQDL